MKNKIMIEIAAAVVVLIILAITGYCFYLRPVFMQFFTICDEMKNNTVLLKKKKDQQMQEKSVVAELDQWKIKHANFYHSVKSMQTVNQLLQPLTVVIQQAGFVVNNIKLAPASSIHQNKLSDVTVQLTLSGAFLNLFSLMNVLNQFEYPICVNQLIIHQNHTYALQLMIRGMHD